MHGLIEPPATGMRAGPATGSVTVTARKEALEAP